jgi:sortase (surface protein transpeptidase)
MHEPDGTQPQILHSHRHSKLQLSLVGMAVMVFVIGLAVSLQTLQANHGASAQVSALSKRTDKQAGNAVPSTTKPSAAAFNSYAVAPDLPRYIKIPKLGVNARVMQVGVNGSGAVGAPSNVFDAAWYTGSAKPGQPGATLIDGHVSSWTTHGVFYGIKTLQAGDTIQVIRGDNTAVNYRVVKTRVYPVDNVDMQAAITPVTAGKAGLNLITCTGQVKKGTSEFNQRLIVFAEQI